MNSSQLFFGALVLSLAGCGEPPAPQAEPAHSSRPDHSVQLTSTSAPYVQVEPAAAAERTSERALVAKVTFDDRKVAMLGPPVQGRVSSVNVLAGDRVAKDAPLLTIRAPDIAAASAQVAQARTGRLLAERNAQRAKTLVEQGAGSEAERVQSEAALEQAKSEERRADAALSALGGSHGANGYQLHSPIAGVVVERNVSVGTEVHVDQDKPLLVVADLSNVWVVADVYEQDLGHIRVGNEARVQVVAFPNREFVGHITYIGSTVDPQTRVAGARIEIENSDLSLRPGMFANVHVKGLSDGVVQVPLSAVLARRDQFFVFTRNANGTFTQREIKPGEQQGQHVAILSGLAPGDEVVTEGAILLDAEANEAL